MRRRVFRPVVREATSQEAIVSGAAMAPIGTSRIDLPCPRCGAKENVALTIAPKIIYSQGPTKGFITADVAIGGVEHTCRADRD